ncbi:MAG TPA: fimbrial protein [Dyella sp.]|uniref:fimbrial protein n=1 Tax=Dyella sp. TaxID=1869338 RepID=UPI002C347546|nr:fimbrial protein [Dyella sp.]HTV87250.1 fimbrial protein [Dyella sp.]
MKNYKLAAVAALIGGFLVAGSAFAADDGGTITFTGAVSSATCSLTGGAGTDGGSGNFTVALNSVAVTDLATAGATANAKDFSINIGAPGQASCTNGTVATMTFVTSSPQIDAATGALKNVLAGEATNTQVQLTDSSGAVINLANPAYSVSSPAIVNNTAQISLRAQYYATGAATPGLVSTSVQYGITYN